MRVEAGVAIDRPRAEVWHYPDYAGQRAGVLGEHGVLRGNVTAASQ